MAALSLEQVVKRYQAIPAVDGIDLQVSDGEFLAVLGPSGCGKTTLLRLIAGLERLSSGEIRFDDRTVSSVDCHLPPEQRRVGIVFQSYALWPHMSVARNVGYALEVAGVRGLDYQRRVATALATVGLQGLEERRPAALSGGQRQRVALARCLVMEPSLVLLDEPLANLDVHLRATLEEEFLAFHAKTGATMVYITHDQAEAMAMAHRIAVMDDGRVQQLSAPEILYQQPATAMVANFIGKGTLLSAEMVDYHGDGQCTVCLLGERYRFRCRDQQQRGQVKVVIRPEGINLAEQGVEGIVRRRIYQGGRYRLEVETVTAELMMEVRDAPPLGAKVRLQITDGWVIPDQTSSHS